MPDQGSSRRVLITGLGLITGHGLGHRALWEALRAGRTAIAPIDPGHVLGFDAGAFDCPLAAVINGLDAKEHVPKSYRKAVKVMARDTEIAVACAALAVADAGLRTRAHDGEAPTYAPPRIGCHIGAGLIATEVGELASAKATAASADGGLDTRAWGTIDDGGDPGPGVAPIGGMNNLQPLWLLKYLPNMLACHVTIVHGAEGPSNTITCAEASGLLSIGESARVIERGAADASLAGGAESKINPMGLLRWGMAGRQARCSVDDAPGDVIRPFDATSRGSILGEGGGILVLEEAGSAHARGRAGIAEIAGFGAAQAVPQRLPYVGEDGESVRLAIGDAIDRALADAGIGAGDVDAVVAMGLGAPGADTSEWSALEGCLGARLAQVPVVTLTQSIGNCVAGHASLLVGVAAMMVREGEAPAGAVVRGARGVMPRGAAEGEGGRVRTVLVCASSMGGQAAAMVVRGVGPTARVPARS